MDLEYARKLLDRIPPTAQVVDVGGGASPFPRADVVLDARAFAERPVHREMPLSYPRRFSKESWHQLDLCERRPWPFPDKQFDYAVCSHLLEDVRDPIWICAELCRIAKSGYVEVPSRVLEQSRGVESPHYAGYCHHRWLVQRSGNGLEFRFKPHMLHSVPGAIVTRLSRNRMINPRHAIITLEWVDHFNFIEVLEFDEDRMIAELCSFAAEARRHPDLTVRSTRPKRSLYTRFRNRLLRVPVLFNRHAQSV